MKITLDEKHLAQLHGIIGEIPHKYAVGFLEFFNRRAREQEPQKQPEAPPTKARKGGRKVAPPG